MCSFAHSSLFSPACLLCMHANMKIASALDCTSADPRRHPIQKASEERNVGNGSAVILDLHKGHHFQGGRASLQPMLPMLDGLVVWG